MTTMSPIALANNLNRRDNMGELKKHNENNFTKYHSSIFHA
jgi:hypothetical protein